MLAFNQQQDDPFADIPVTRPPASGPPSTASRMGAPLVGPPRQPSPLTPDQATIQAGQAGAAAYDVPSAQARTAAEAANAARAAQQTQQGRTNGANFSDENTLRAAFVADPATRRYTDVLPSYYAAMHAGDTRAGDLDLVYAYASLMDPGSVVREGESVMVRGTGTVADQAQGYLSTITGAGQLTPEMRRNLRSELHLRGQGIGSAYQQRRDFYNGLARHYGFDPNNITGPHPADALNAAAAASQPPVAPTISHEGPNGGPRAGPGEHLQFNDEAPASPLSGEQASAYDAFMRANPRATADQLRAFGTSIGRNISNADAIVQARDRGGGFIPGGQAIYGQVDISGARGGALSPGGQAVNVALPGGLEGIDAYLRSTSNSALAGIPDRAEAATDTLFSGGTYRDNLARQRAITSYDWQHHFPAALAGTLTGGALIPSGAAGDARSATLAMMRESRAALAAGVPRSAVREGALDAGRAAAARRIGAEGAGYGAVGGYTQSDGHPFRDAALGGFTGGLISHGLGNLGGALRIGENRPRPPQLPPLIGGTGRLNQPLEAARPGQRVNAAREFGIDLPLGAATDRPGAIISQGLRNYPGSAGVMSDSGLALQDQATAAVDKVAGRYGNAATMREGGVRLQEGAQNWINRFEHVSGRAYDAIPISPHSPTDLTNTRRSLSEMTSRFGSNQELAAIMQNPQLMRYQSALSPRAGDELERAATAMEGAARRLDPSVTINRTRPGGLNWQDLKDFRSQIGAQIGEARFSDTPTRDDLRGLYGALSEDMKQSAVAQGPRAVAAFNRANDLYRNGQQRIEGALVSILGDDSRQRPELAAQRLQTILRGGRGTSDLARAQAIRASLGKGPEWDAAASSMIRLMGQPVNSQGRDFNPQTFVQNYADMSPEGRDLLFGGGNRDLRQALDRFVAVNQRLVRANALRNTSQTAPVISGIGAVASVGAAIAHPAYGLGIATSMGGAYGLARLWTNPKFVRLMTNASASGNPSTARRILRSGLASMARTYPTLATDINALDQRIFQGEPQ